MLLIYLPGASSLLHFWRSIRNTSRIHQVGAFKSSFTLHIQLTSPPSGQSVPLPCLCHCIYWGDDAPYTQSIAKLYHIICLYIKDTVSNSRSDICFSSKLLHVLRFWWRLWPFSQLLTCRCCIALPLVTHLCSAYITQQWPKDVQMQVACALEESSVFPQAAVRGAQRFV